LASILHYFGEVTGLCINFLKSSVAPIRCGNIDLDDILEGIPTTRASFPLQYLGLPSRFGALREEIFNIMKINVLESFLLGLASSSPWPAGLLL
jgi:hypothetical protein